MGKLLEFDQIDAIVGIRLRRLALQSFRTAIQLKTASRSENTIRIAPRAHNPGRSTARRSGRQAEWAELSLSDGDGGRGTPRSIR